MRLYWDDFNYRQRRHKLFGLLVCNATFCHVPGSAFQKQPMHKTACKWNAECETVIPKEYKINQVCCKHRWPHEILLPNCTKSGQQIQTSHDRHTCGRPSRPIDQVYDVYVVCERRYLRWIHYPQVESNSE